MEKKAMHMVFFLCVSCTYLQVVNTNTYPIHHSDEEEGEYGIVLDGGSTGTKLKIFKWRRDLKSQNSAIKLELVESTKYKPAISYYATHLEGVEGYLGVITARAREIVPTWKQPRTPIYFMATAGLRVLSVSATIALLETIETCLMKTKFLTQGDFVRVLSGEEEGVYAWIAANYLRGFFWSNKPVNQSVGVLEMGGGSTQIVFLPDSPIYANMFPVRLGGHEYKLYAHSYLFYGQNFIILRINEYLVRIHGKVSHLENPCMLVGDNTTFTSSAGSVHIAGSANMFKCLEILEVFLKSAEDSWCYPKPCAIGRTYQPAVGNTEFYAISAFVYAPSYLEAVAANGRLNISLLLEKAEVYCSKTLQEVTSSGLPAGFASSYCTMGLYIPSLLVDAYRFDIKSESIYVTSEIEDVTIDWAMGAIILQIDNNMQLLVDNNCDTSGTSGTLYHFHKTDTFSFILFAVAICLCLKELLDQIG